MASKVIAAAVAAATVPSGNIPLPSEGFVPSATRSHGISHNLRAFFDAAFTQYQNEHKDACITNVSLVKALRLSWYPYLEKQGYNRNTCSVVAGEWYKTARRNVAMIRDPEVLAKLKK